MENAIENLLDESVKKNIPFIQINFYELNHETMKSMLIKFKEMGADAIAHKDNDLWRIEATFQTM